MKRLTKKDLLKKMARTLRTRTIDRICLEPHITDKDIFTKIIEFTNGDTLRLLYLNNKLYCYHFIKDDYKSNAYFLDDITSTYKKSR